MGNVANNSSNLMARSPEAKYLAGQAAKALLVLNKLISPVKIQTESF
jgi:hypothetical protein